MKVLPFNLASLKFLRKFTVKTFGYGGMEGAHKRLVGGILKLFELFCMNEYVHMNGDSCDVM